ncbi:MAG: hypothetical protein ACKVOU_14100 [Cytophagales bacterium]
MLEQVNKLLFDGFKCRVHKKPNSSFELIEDNKNAKCKKAGFRAIHEVLVYKFDKFPKREGKEIIHRHPYFNDGKAIAMCDYILFYETRKSNLGVVICNLKSDHDSNNIDQIKAGEIFSNYVFETLKRLYPSVFTNDLILKKVFFSSNPRISVTTKYQKNNRLKTKRLFSSNDNFDIYDLDLRLNM